MSKFDFEVDVNMNGDVTKSLVFFKDTENGIEVNVDSDTLKNDKSMTRYHDINRPKFPKIWTRGGHIQLIP